jgi:hypothetical protein
MSAYALGSGPWLREVSLPNNSQYARRCTKGVPLPQPSQVQSPALYSARIPATRGFWFMVVGFYDYEYK